jgi:hypothetical protein
VSGAVVVGGSPVVVGTVVGVITVVGVGATVVVGLGAGLVVVGLRLLVCRELVEVVVRAVVDAGADVVDVDVVDCAVVV